MGTFHRVTVDTPVDCNVFVLTPLVQPQPEDMFYIGDAHIIGFNVILLLFYYPIFRTREGMVYLGIRFGSIQTYYLYSKDGKYNDEFQMGMLGRLTV